MITNKFVPFWEKFLPKLIGRTNLHASSKVSTSNYLAQSAGYPYIDYRYLPRKNSTAVALFIDTGDVERNREIFRRLLKHKDEIETAFGESLEWSPYEHSRNIKVQKRVTYIGINHQGQWDQIQDEMIDAMIRLERAFREHIQALHNPE